MAKRGSHTFGLHAVAALLTATPERVCRLQVVSSRNDRRTRDVLAQAQAHGIPVERVTRQALDERFPETTHQGLVAELKGLAPGGERQLEAFLEGVREPLLLILDQVQDPHNLGACLRTADAAGVTGVIVPKDRAATLTPAAVKVASGAAEAVPFFQVTNLARTFGALQARGIWLVGTADDASENLYETDLTGPLALVMGGEGRGLRRLTRDRCDRLVRIPMTGSVGSLNVSVATGVCLFEIRRQRLAQIPQA